MATSLPSTSLHRLSDQNTHETAMSDLPVLPLTQTEPTVNQVWGPFYVQNAPFRAKISPVHSLGVPLVITGNVFALDTRRPLPFVSIDIWHASPEGVYDYYEADPNLKFDSITELNTHGRSLNFDYRARLITDERGRYEFETIKSPAYYNKITYRWRCPHIHYYVQASGYKPIVTELYFKGEDKNDIDTHIQESTTIELRTIECERSDGSKFSYYKGQFDLVMAPNTDDGQRKEEHEPMKKV